MTVPCCLQACDKLTYINNRDLLYDLNSYINNVRVILHACNNYLKVSPTLSSALILLILPCP